MVSRRRFLRRVSAGMAAGVAAARCQTLDAVAGLGQSDLPTDERWGRVRGAFMLDPQWAYMNNGTLGPMPRPVYDTVVERYRELAAQPGAPNAVHGRLMEEVRKKAAAFVGADPDEIALTRNTTEGMAFVINGLDLRAGDEIVMSAHEHPGGREPCRLKAARQGVVLKEVPLAAPASEPSEILSAFRAAITTRTRVVMVSHMMFETGTMIPVKPLAELVRTTTKAVLLVDGAHPLGMLRLDMHDLGVDYYATSAHKWLDAPTGTGLLYLRRAAQDRVWPTVVTTGWDDPSRGAARFDRLSQRASPLVLAVGAAIDFQIAIGADQIELRVRALHGRLRSKLSTIPGVRLHTSAHPDLSGGLLTFTVGALDNADVVETLKQRHRVWVRTIGGGLNAVRASTHIFNTEEEVDRLVEGVQECLRNGVVR